MNNSEVKYGLLPETNLLESHLRVAQSEYPETITVISFNEVNLETGLVWSGLGQMDQGKWFRLRGLGQGVYVFWDGGESMFFIFHWLAVGGSEVGWVRWFRSDDLGQVVFRTQVSQCSSLFTVPV